MVSGTEAHTYALKAEVAEVLVPMGLRLSEEKTTICHIDQGFDFLGYRIQRRRGRGKTKRYVYTYPAKKVFGTLTRRWRSCCTDSTRCCEARPTTSATGRRANIQLPGLLRVAPGDRMAALQASPHQLEATPTRYLQGWWPTEGKVTLFNPDAVATVRYRYRGNTIPAPWFTTTEESAT